MKKFIVAGIVIVLIAVAGTVVVQSSKDKNEDKSSNSNTTTNTESTKSAVKPACELLTLEDSKRLIGDNAAIAEGSGGPNLATTEDVKVDNCTYSADGATLGDLKQITIQIQSGDAAQVKQAYENYKKEYPGDPLSDLGDEAYYAKEAKQVNVLKDGVWVFSAGGSINAGEEANKQLEVKAAQTVLEKL